MPVKAVRNVAGRGHFGKESVTDHRYVPLPFCWPLVDRTLKEFFSWACCPSLLPEEVRCRKEAERRCWLGNASYEFNASDPVLEQRW